MDIENINDVIEQANNRIKTAARRKAEQDLGAWQNKIIEAAKKGETALDNVPKTTLWNSLFGKRAEHPMHHPASAFAKAYAEALQELLGEGFIVSALVYDDISVWWLPHNQTKRPPLMIEPPQPEAQPIIH